MTFHQISKDEKGRSVVYSSDPLHLALASHTQLEHNGYEPRLIVSANQYGAAEYTVSAEGILPITYIKGV